MNPAVSPSRPCASSATRRSVAGTRPAPTILARRSAATSLRRLVRKLDRASRKLEGAEDAPGAARMEMGARRTRQPPGARRSATRSTRPAPCTSPERLHAARIALKKLRYGARARRRVARLEEHAELRALKRMQECSDVCTIFRCWSIASDGVQASLAPPSVSRRGAISTRC